MKLFKKVAIVGVGLIGGSIGLAIKKKKLASEVVGVSRHKGTLQKALKSGAIDRGSLNLSIIRGADLVILCAPVGIIIKQAREVAAQAKEEAIITDVGSTKEEIVVKLGKVFPGFIGAHPLAGSQKRGISNASSKLFKGSICVLTPTPVTKKISLRKVKSFWESLGAKVVFLSPSRHDKILSLASHLPHLLAFSLVYALPRGCFKFAAGGFRDTTRIASSDGRIWSDVFLSNRANILRAVKIFQKQLAAFKSVLSRKDRKKLEAMLKKARLKRESLL